jgi:lipid-A-disaccharide synthase
MICIFPFEKELYEKSGLPTLFAGHPMVDRLNALRTGKPRDETLVALLPGSREREISKIFPVLLDAARIMQRARPELRFAAAAASKKLAARMKEMQGDQKICDIQIGNAYDLMQHAGTGAVASGTASLEAAFFGLPYCLVYKVAPLTYIAARMLMKVEFLGMVNILAGREVVHEFLQKEAEPRLIADELLRLTNSEDARTKLASKLAQATSQLGEGQAHHRAAKVILDQLQ